MSSGASSIELRVNNQKLIGWQEADILRSIDNVFAEASLSLSEGGPDGSRRPGEARSKQEQSAPPPVRMGDSCTLLLKGQVLITGLVTAHDLTLDDKGYDLGVTVRDRTWLLSKGSVLRDPAEWSGVDALRIITDICAPFGIGVFAQTPVGNLFEKFTVQPGETALRAIERLCRYRALLFFADRNGNLLLSSADQAKRAGTLAPGEGGNVLSLRNAGSLDGRNSEYIVRNQTRGSNWGSAAHTRLEGRARDRGFPVYCPLISLADEAESNLREVATTKAAVNAGRSLSREYTVEGWTQEDGRLWDINGLSRVFDHTDSASAGDLLIKSCRYTISEDQSEQTTLTLVPPAAYALREEPQKNMTKSKWGAAQGTAEHKTGAVARSAEQRSGAQL